MCEVAAIGAVISSVGGAIGDAAATRAENQAKQEAWIRQNREYDVEANLTDVQYLNDVQEFDIENDMMYQAMLNQWQESDLELNRLFAQEDHRIEDAIIEMHQNDYAGTQTGASAARLAMAPAMKLGMIKSRALHDKMYASDRTTLQKEMTREDTSRDQWKKYMDEAAFAPIHGFRPAPPQYKAGPSPAAVILGVAGSAIGAASDEWKPFGG